METHMDTRQKLMHSAAELIVEVGFEGMTTAAVAKRAGVSEGAIYRHFPSKEALAEAVFADIWRIYIGLMEKHLPPRERPKERLDAFFKATLAALDDLMPSYGALCQQDHLHYAAKHVPSATSLPAGAPEYAPQLFLNDGHRTLHPAPEGALPPLPISAGALAAADFDHSGRLGVFLGGRVLPGGYPLSPKSALLANRGGRFEDVTDSLAPRTAAVCISRS